MKIDLDIPVNIGDSIFFFDSVLARHEAKVEAIHIQYLRPYKEPNIEIDWVQYDESIDGDELWDSGTVEFDDLGNSFWLTYEDMVKANQDDFDDYDREIREQRQEEAW